MAKQYITDLSLIERLAEIRGKMEVVQKDKMGFGYKYVTEDNLYAHLSTQLKNFQVSLIPRIVPGTLNVTPYSYKKIKVVKGVPTEDIVNEIIVDAEMVFTWVCNDKPEDRLEVPWVLVGQQNDGAQALGSALTYTSRYFIMKYFNIATPEDDPDAWRTKQKEAANKEEALILNTSIEEFGAIVTSFLAGSTDELKQEARDFIGKYIKGGDYRKISSQDIINKLAADFVAHFKVGKE